MPLPPSSEFRPTAHRSAIVAICGLLLLGVVVVFGQIVRHDFISLDDATYVSKNRLIQNGLSLRGALWSLLHFHSYNWHPLTTVTHMLDCQWFGLNAGGHHAGNLILHGVSACLLFLLLVRLTDDLWPSAVAAAIFDIHPLRVESVAWVSERKDVLAGLFFFSTLLAYTSYCRKGQTAFRYLLVTLLYLAGLMSKPMLVTLPMVLLLLDVWPLRRWQPLRDGAESDRMVGLRLILEKLPWFLMSAASCAITYFGQNACMPSFERIPVAMRISNAAIAYIGYLKMALWPSGSTIVYPYPSGAASFVALGTAVAILSAISVVAVMCRRKSPYLTIGWFWYLGMLVPVIGIIQVGVQSMADRYTYLPQVGLSIAIVWTARDLLKRWPKGRTLTSVLVAAVLGLCLIAAWRQTSFWKNDLTLWSRAVDCTPDFADARIMLSEALYDRKRESEAMDQIEVARRLRPDDPRVHLDLGIMLADAGKTDEAIAEVERAVKLQENAAKTQYYLAHLLATAGRKKEAIGYLVHVGSLEPDNVMARQFHAWLLATSTPANGGDPHQAVQIAQWTISQVPEPGPDEYDLLAAAYASAGQYSKALTAAQRARELAVAARQNSLAEKIEERIKLYEAGKPYRE